MRPITKPTQLQKDLRAIYGDGVTYSIMVGLGETYIPAFALAIGMSEVTAGWIVSIPLLLGAILQLISPWAVQQLGSHKRWVIICACGQASCYIGFLIQAVMGNLPHALMFITATLYWGSGMAAGPAWNTWVGTIIPPKIRARYFANRGRTCQAAVLLGLIVAGIALRIGQNTQYLLYIFAGLFLAAGIARFTSIGYLVAQSEPLPIPPNLRKVSITEMLKRARHGNDGKLLLYMLSVQIAVQISAPFFTPFMISELQFSYSQYLLLIATAYVAKMIALSFMGSVVKKFGSNWLLYTVGVGIIPLSAMWTLSDSIIFLLALQIIAGIIWAGYELATLLLLFDHIDESERTSVLTIFNFANALALLGGAILGGLLLKYLNTDKHAYHVIFVLSGAARIISLFFLFKLQRVTFKPIQIATRILGVRPNTGSVNVPIVSSFSDDDDDDNIVDE